MFIHSAPIISETVSADAVLILLFAFPAVLLPFFLRKRFFSGNSAAEYKGRIKTAGILLLIAAFRIPAVQAVDITLGSGPVTTGNQVYFGYYGDEPVLWRVMGEGNAGSGKILLSVYLLGRTFFNPVDAEEPNNWQGSSAQNWCGNFYLSNFTAAEQSAVIPTRKTDSSYRSEDNYLFDDSYLNDEYVFFLSAQEAETYFDKTDNAKKIAYWQNNQSTADYWWLRSP